VLVVDRTLARGGAPVEDCVWCYPPRERAGHAMNGEGVCYRSNGAIRPYVRRSALVEGDYRFGRLEADRDSVDDRPEGAGVHDDDACGAE